MDSCKYYYRHSYCANNLITSTTCVGGEECNHILQGAEVMSDASSSDGCFGGLSEWYGIYCPKYKRFYCAGKDNCETMEEYMNNFKRFQENGGQDD